MINVTEPFLPPKEEYISFVNEIWNRNWLTNNGPLVNELELQLKDYLNLDHLLFVTNGTIALQLGIKALGLQGEIITTPFSYVATTSSIVWENCKPVFVDIDKDTLNLDPFLIENAITENTSAILATHVYGNPCDVEAIEAISRKHNLKVIYDGAHSFGSEYNKKSIFEWGDISTCSFHATKLFHTIEGGSVITKDPAVLKKLSFLRNFGHNGPTIFEGVGINGKNSEFHAAMGLTNIKYIDQILQKRKVDSEYYDHLLLEKLKVRRPKITEGTTVYNHSYYPIIFESEELLLRAVDELEKNRITPRRYFYPSLTELNYVEKRETPITDDISKRVLCLPLYYSITKAEIDMIVRFILRSQKYF
ncbi:DegT/DnrJ/EryC1/StrS family aminotransferase [Christiangramia sp. ASW11-125]|uniref:DegT/DnrJ/EryC1/StrS family aminotransferase n=1 Tax=Christiangramia sp. ASW11-125 TaxID=3400701 RepID=UPI003AACAB2E